MDVVGGGIEADSPWKNLKLICSLQDADKDLPEKINLALDHVISWNAAERARIMWRPQVMDTCRTIGFLSNWVHSVLISSVKKVRHEGIKPKFGTPGSFLDLRCWKVLHWCLEESKNLHHTMHCPKDFLRVIHDVVMEDLYCMADDIGKIMSSDRHEFYTVVLDCVSLVFSYHGGVANENLELWILLLDRVLGLLLKNDSGDFLDDSTAGNFISKLSCCLLEPFAKFLRIHPPRKNGFHTFIDELMEPLLHLLHVLNIGSSGNDIYMTLRNLIEEILACGLFHPTHIDGFLNLQIACNYINRTDTTEKEKRLVNKSYHRHLFNKVEKMVAKKNRLALCGLGELLHLFLICVSKHKQDSVVEELLSKPDLGSTDPNSSLDGKADGLKKVLVRHSKDSTLRKNSFEFFVQICEYLLADLNKYVNLDWNVTSEFEHVFSLLSPINNLLSWVITDRIYLRTEDTLDGASKNFLKFIYDIMLSLSAKLFQSTLPGTDEKSCKKLLASTIKELMLGIHNILNIEYGVIDDNIECLWTTIFSSIVTWSASMDVSGQKFLPVEILNLECRLIDIFAELRQVDSCIFALCRALRNYILLDKIEVFMSCSTNSLSMLFCSSEFRVAVGNAVKAMPEGRVAGCLQQLSLDAKDSLNWTRVEHQTTVVNEFQNLNPYGCGFHRLRAELLGMVLCEFYALILDSITVTSGNSYRVADYLKDLVEILGLSLRGIISLESNSGMEISILVNGNIPNKKEAEKMSLSWILVFLFRLLLSSRSLFRELICLLPMKASKKMSEVIGDSFTSISGGDWLNMANIATKGFLSHVILPSANLLSIIRAVFDTCIQDSVILCPPLVYILNTMSLQRLVELNRFIESLNYMLQWKQKFDSSKLNGDSHLALDHLEMICTQARNEAESLTEFVLEFLGASFFELTPLQIMDHIDGLKLPMGSLDNQTLPCAMWSILYRDFDIWCSHAAKKDLKNFLRLPIQASLFCTLDLDYHLIAETMGNPVDLMKILLHQIASKVLSCLKANKRKFACRYMVSKLCRCLQKSMCSFFAGSEITLSEITDWVEGIKTIEKTTDVSNSNVMSDVASPHKQDAEFRTCRLILSILMQIPEEILSSFSSYTTYILNLERVLVDKLLGYQASSHSLYMIFQLFVDCRKVLQKATVSIAEGNEFAVQSPWMSSFFLQWILKSVLAVYGREYSFPQDLGCNAKDIVFALLNQTSSLVRRVCRYEFENLSSIHISESKLNALENSEELESEQKLKVSGSVSELVLTMEEHFKLSLTTLQHANSNRVEGSSLGFKNLNKFSSLVACFQGLLWGMASLSCETCLVEKNCLANFFSSHDQLATRIKSCVDIFADFASFVLRSLFIEYEETMQMGCGTSALKAEETYCNNGTDMFCTPNGVSCTLKKVPFDMKCNLRNVKLKGTSRLPVSNLGAYLAEVQRCKLRLKKSILLQILKGENDEAAYLLQQLLLAGSAILRLNLQIDLGSTVWIISPVMLGISQFLLLEFSRYERPQHHVFRLSGSINFLEELGSYFPLFDPTLSKDLFTDLMALHLRAIGKCIAIQRKEERFASQDMASLARKPAILALSGFSTGDSPLALKDRLRNSFRTYLKKSTKFHLLSSIQILERALIGIQEGLMSKYEILYHGSNGGEVSHVVAGGIDGFDMILESVSGPKRLNMIKKHIEGLVSCLFNIILHVQGSGIFCISSEMDITPSGLVILMCTEVITKVLQKPARFPIDSSHVSSSIHLPGAVFQYFLELHSGASVKTGPNQINLDTEFSMKLYGGCCRLLSSAIKHHKDETQPCIALLQYSVSVLLHCLEIVHPHAVSGWELEKAVACACSLRRVYEEVRQQKDVFGKYSFHFLANYICVYCGLGPAGYGIVREVDEALRPGVYALLDSCSPDDLQYLHTSFGEGPRRSILASLQHDYKINFQFQGKV